MITETEKRALALAKKVFEHFTHDALPIAREILAMEIDLGAAPANGHPLNGSFRNMAVADCPSTGNGPFDDPAMPGGVLPPEMTYKPEDDLPF